MTAMIANADFSGTITLGTILIGVLVSVLFFLGTLKDRQTGRWRDLYDLADQERKELQHELNEARELGSHLKEQVANSEALQMPAEVTAPLREAAEEAGHRQVQIRQHLERHEEAAERRGNATLNVLGMIPDKPGHEPNGGHR